MDKLTENCKLGIQLYCAGCGEFKPNIDTYEVLDAVDKNGYMTDRTDYEISCSHSVICAKWDELIRTKYLVK